MFLFLRWKRNTWISKVSFGLRFNSAPQSKCSFSPDRGFVGAITEISIGCEVRVQLELELMQTQMAQKPMLRAEVGMRVRCANKASAE